MVLRGRRGAVASALALGLVTPLPQASACPDPDDPPLVLYYADTLTVTLRAGRKSYRPGEAATITVTVERRGPADLTNEPVAAEVTATLRRPNGVEPERFAFTLPETGTKTKVWRIPRGLRGGPLEVEATALYELLPSASCYSSLAYERGTVRIANFIKIAG